MGNLVYQHVFRPRCFRLASLAENAIHQESPAVGCPPYDHQRINLPISSVASYRR
ncbi:MAG: hypothetical protein LBQ66_08055 [Planctomycetaceae bacterium]|nr:hypothetical protein [Planctomycetaceae bacterium]